jgi:hypothetical protein
MEILVNSLRGAYPKLLFVPGDIAKWSPSDREITYPRKSSQTSVWSLFHELGHALLEHDSYLNDLDLLQKEAAAWQMAIALAKEHGFKIASGHIQDCLDTYRDWVHKRSACPQCASHGLQASERTYSCLNCASSWEVSDSRFCRPYRLKKL